MKPNWKRIGHIIRTDIITMNGGKNNLLFTVIIMALLIFAGTFFLSPLVVIYAPLGISGYFVPMIFQNEAKYHSEKMYNVLPVPRHELVTARFILVFGVNLVFAVLSFLVMCLSFKLHIYIVFDGNDITSMIAEKAAGSLNAFEWTRMMFLAGETLAMFMVPQQLKNYFKDNQKFSNKVIFSKKGKPTKQDIQDAMPVVFWLCVAAFFMLVITGMIPVGPAGMLVMTILGKLGEAMHGWLLSAVFIIIGVMNVVLFYVKTQLMYEKKEL